MGLLEIFSLPKLKGVPAFTVGQLLFGCQSAGCVALEGGKMEGK